MYSETLSIRNFPRVDFFVFSSLGWKVQGSISRNIRKAFFRENIRIFLLLEQESSISGNIRNFLGVDFFWFFGLGWEVHKMALKYTTALILTSPLLISESQGYFSKNLYGPFSWMAFHCLKATERIWEDSLLFTK